MKKLIVVHQYNWRKALEAPRRSGAPRLPIGFIYSKLYKRIQHILPENVYAVHYCNAAPNTLSGSTLAPNTSLLRSTIERVEPDILLACGKIAERASLSVWDGSIFCVPDLDSSRVGDSLLSFTKLILASRPLQRQTWRYTIKQLDGKRFDAVEIKADAD